LRICFLLFGSILLDQLTKHLVRMTMSVGQSVSVVGDVVRITFVENTGIVFGIRVGPPVIFTILSGIASIGIAVYLYRNRRTGFRMTGGLTLILSGAVGNLTDRILFAKVVDFIDIGIRHIRWPVFNVADSAVVVGMFWLLFFTFRSESHDASGGRSSPEIP